MKCNHEYGWEYEALSSFFDAINRAVKAISSLAEEIIAHYAEVVEVYESVSPILYVRKFCGTAYALRTIYGRNEIYRAKQYVRRHIPCAHAADGGVVIKHGRHVRKKKG